MYNPELYHHGIMGMKWGVRRYQNPDGTLTAAGRARYGTGVARSYSIGYKLTSDARKDIKRINDAYNRDIKAAKIKYKNKLKDNKDDFKYENKMTPEKYKANKKKAKKEYQKIVNKKFDEYNKASMDLSETSMKAYASAIGKENLNKVKIKGLVEAGAGLAGLVLANYALSASPYDFSSPYSQMGMMVVGSVLGPLALGMGVADITNASVTKDVTDKEK